MWLVCHAGENARPSRPDLGADDEVAPRARRSRRATVDGRGACRWRSMRQHLAALLPDVEAGGSPGACAIAERRRERRRRLGNASTSCQRDGARRARGAVQLPEYVPRGGRRHVRRPVDAVVATVTADERRPQRRGERDEVERACARLYHAGTSVALDQPDNGRQAQEDRGGRADDENEGEGSKSADRALSPRRRRVPRGERSVEAGAQRRRPTSRRDPGDVRAGRARGQEPLAPATSRADKDVDLEGVV